jgi:glycosyltransferase involved in cell wall biosynthesis
MPKPLVSVVIPAYEAEEFLAEAIESALAQTYPEVETIVVDDCSPDRSGEIAAGYEGVVLVEQQENRGVAAARNAGVAASTGTFVAFLDADDAMLPHRLEVQVGHLLANPGVGYVLAGQETFSEEGAPVPFWAKVEEEPRPDGEGEAGAWDHYPMSMVLSRRVFDEIGGFDETLLLGNDDADLLLRLSEARIEFTRLPDILFRRRIHAGNVSQDEDQAKTAIFELFMRRIDRHRAERP